MTHYGDARGKAQARGSDPTLITELDNLGAALWAVLSKSSHSDAAVAVLKIGNRAGGMTAPGPKRRKTTSARMSAIEGISGRVLLDLSLAVHQQISDSAGAVAVTVEEQTRAVASGINRASAEARTSAESMSR